MISKNDLWCEKYRPKVLEELVLESSTKELLNKFIAEKSIPHLLFLGNVGCQPKGQKVLMADGSWKDVSDVCVGDCVKSPQKDGSFQDVLVKEIKSYLSSIYTVVLGTRTKRRKERLSGYGANHGQYRVAGDHLVVLKCATCGTFENVKVCELRGNFLSHYHSIFSPAVPFSEKKYTLKPYHLGLLLGDGCLSGRDTGLGITNINEEVIIEIYKLARDFNVLVKKNKISYNFTMGETHRGGKGVGKNELKNELRRLGLYGCRSGTKFIPEVYLRGSVKQRLELLAGLLDTDGYRAPNSRATFTISTKSMRLAEDINYLAKSLGFGVSRKISRNSWTYKGVRKSGLYYILAISTQDLIVPVRVSYKKQLGVRVYCKKNIDVRSKKTYVYSDSISELVYGFTLESESGWYITNDWVITHNTGKTTIAKILVDLLDCDHILLNASDERGIEVIREKIKRFAMMSSFKKWKIVFMDEFDNCTPDAQFSLRNILETYSEQTRFIFTGNYGNKIIEPIRSRCQTIEFKNLQRKDIRLLLEKILKNEGIEHDIDDVLILIDTYYPDIRSMINNIQLHTIDKKWSLKGTDSFRNFEKLVELLKKGDLASIRGLDLEYKEAYQYLFDKVNELTEDEQKRVDIMLLIAEYLYREWGIADKSINFAACCLEIIGKLK